jgi:hypothetical protein
MPRKRETYLQIDMPFSWAEAYWDTYGFDYATHMAPVVAWPLEGTSLRALKTALDADGISYTTFVADTERMFAGTKVNPETRKLRFVEVRGTRYIRAEDVAEYIRELGETEETDVRRRLSLAADNILRGRV